MPCVYGVAPPDSAQCCVGSCGVACRSGGTNTAVRYVHVCMCIACVHVCMCACALRMCMCVSQLRFQREIISCFHAVLCSALKAQ